MEDKFKIYDETEEKTTDAEVTETTEETQRTNARKIEINVFIFFISNTSIYIVSVTYRIVNNIC